MGGVPFTGSFFTGTSGLAENQNETIRQAVQADASFLASGSYPYRLAVTSHFGAAEVTSRQEGHLLVNNLVDSPFGAGWGLAGFERLHVGADNSATITGGDGTILRFPPDLASGYVELRDLGTSNIGY